MSFEMIMNSRTLKQSSILSNHYHCLISQEKNHYTKQTIFMQMPNLLTVNARHVVKITKVISYEFKKIQKFVNFD